MLAAVCFLSSGRLVNFTSYLWLEIVLLRNLVHVDLVLQLLRRLFLQVLVLLVAVFRLGVDLLQLWVEDMPLSLQTFTLHHRLVILVFVKFRVDLAVPLTERLLIFLSYPASKRKNINVSLHLLHTEAAEAVPAVVTQMQAPLDVFAFEKSGVAMHLTAPVFEHNLETAVFVHDADLDCFPALVKQGQQSG